MSCMNPLSTIRYVLEVFNAIEERLRQYAMGNCPPMDLIGAAETKVADASRALVELRTQLEDDQVKEGQRPADPGNEVEEATPNLSHINILEGVQYAVEALGEVERLLGSHNEPKPSLMDLISAIETNVIDASRVLTGIEIQLRECWVQDGQGETDDSEMQEHICPYCQVKTTYDPVTGRAEIGRCPHLVKFSLVNAKGAISLFVLHFPDVDAMLGMTGARDFPSIAAKLLNIVLLELEIEGIRKELDREDETERGLKVQIGYLEQQLNETKDQVRRWTKQIWRPKAN